MMEPTRIRAVLNDGYTDLRMQIAHPMETGLRKDAAGNRVSAHYITEVTVTHQGSVLLKARFGPSMAKDPYLGLVMGGGAVGDEIVVSWLDNRGQSRSDTVRIK